MIDRYSKRKIILNNSDIYSDFLAERDKKQLYQYDTPIFKYPTEDQLKKIQYIEHTWTQGDRLYKLSQQYLSDKNNWWIILKFNKIGSEALIKAGDVIKVPLNIEEIVGFFL